MMIIGKHFEFEAAHTLPNEECYGKCRNLHGHTYKLTVKIEGPVDQKGWITNFSDVKAIVRARVIDRLDHSYLNDLIPSPTTAENILVWIYEEISPEINKKAIRVHELILYETSNSFAIYRP